MPARKAKRKVVEGHVYLVRMVVGKENAKGRRSVRITYTDPSTGKDKHSNTSISGDATAQRSRMRDLIRKWATVGSKLIVEETESGKRHSYVKQGDRYVSSSTVAGSRRGTHIAAEEGNQERAMAEKVTSVRIHIGAAKDGVRSVSVRRGSKTVTGSLEGSVTAQKKGLQRLIRAWCRTGVKVVMSVEGSKEVCTYTKEGARYVCEKSTKKTTRRKAESTKAKTTTVEEAAPEARKSRKSRKTGTRKASAYNKFVAAQMKAGKTMAQAAAAWRAQSGTTAKKTARRRRSNAMTEREKREWDEAVMAAGLSELTTGAGVSAYNKFVAAQMKAGKSMKEAAAAWRAQSGTTAKKTVKKTSKAKAAKPKTSKAKSGTRKVSAYNKFVAAQRKAGKSMKEAAAAWRAHKGETAKTEVIKKKTTKAKTTKAKTTKAKAKTTKAKAKTTKATTSNALPAVGDVVAAAALRTARRKHGAVKKRSAPKRRTSKR